MRKMKALSVDRKFLGMLMVLMSGLFLWPTLAASQNGANAICTSAGCTTITGSTAFIDASVITGPGGATDVCARINGALTSSYPTTARVIDARGINSGNSNMTCPPGDTPWVYGTSVTSANAAILLPPGTINIQTTWILPNQTRLIGVGRQMTRIVWTGTTGGDMIDMCSSACFGVGVSDLTLAGGGPTVINNGIVNNNAQEETYVDRVNFTLIDGIALEIGSGAGNSGPYSNIVMVIKRA